MGADGMLNIPDRPWLGITLNMDALEKYTGVKHFLD
jgi:L-alanine-DL-glutamate epimerase-like enolase superfamily enzyme